MGKDIAVALVGVPRASSFLKTFQAHPSTRVAALCDLNRTLLAEIGQQVGGTPLYTDYEQMLSEARFDAVILATPMHLHASQAIAALQRGIHVLCEVPAAISLEEAQRLVKVCKQSPAVFMMAENYTYIRSNLLVRELVRRGFFGELYYAEGEYLHELKGLNEITPWRRQWQTGRDGITYGTHSLGPVLQWMEGDRVVRVCCEGSGHHYRDPRDNLYENQDSCVMLCKTSRGALIKIRLDMLSNRPHAMHNYCLQGTRGCYESARSPAEQDRIWLADLCTNANSWRNLANLEAEYLPARWRNPPEETLEVGHWDGDYFEAVDFINSVLDHTPPPIGIHEAMDMTVPGLISQSSIANGAIWMDVPDSRTW